MSCSGMHLVKGHDIYFNSDDAIKKHYRKHATLEKKGCNNKTL
jgi:hypothetical protein